MAIKIPEVVQQPVGEFALGNIPTPDVAQKSKALGRLIDAMGDSELIGDVDEATGEAARELTELRSILVNSNSLDAEFVGDDALAELQITVSDGKGGRQEISKPRVFTHEVAQEIWDKRSQEIVDNYSGRISNPTARAKFTEEIMTRYVVPGGSAVTGAAAVKSRAYGQARAERGIEGVLSSDAPTEVKESQAKEIISRQLILGADPVWAENQLAAIGPMVDQIEVQNQIMGAQDADQIDQIEENMWSGEFRGTPAQMRTLSGVMDQRRRDFIGQKKLDQDANADQLFGEFVGGELTAQRVSEQVTSDQITKEAGWTFINALTKGSTTRASQPWTLSKYRGEIQRLQYTGNRMRVSDKAKLLKLIVTRGSMGLTPQGLPSGQPPEITGEDAFKLTKDIDAAVKAATENQAYIDAYTAVKTHTGVTNDIYGQLLGTQDQREAAIAFKTALDNYMDQFGIDANPVEFFEANKSAYEPQKFTRGINAAFLNAVPSVADYMTQTGTGVDISMEFTKANQENFLLWLAGPGAATMSPDRYAQVAALYKQYYQGQGIAPNNGELMLEDDDPLYRQFEAAIPEE